MADFVLNIAKGRAAELYNRVESNDPANSALVVVALSISSSPPTSEDAAIKDADTLAAVLALGNVAEVTNSGYSRKVLTDSDLAAIPAPDDTNDRNERDIPDQTFGTIGAGDEWHVLLVCYNPDTTASPQSDANIVPLTKHDFVTTPDGNDIVATINAAGFYRAGE